MWICFIMVELFLLHLNTPISKVWGSVSQAQCTLMAGIVRWQFPSLSSTTWWRHQMETFSALLAICAGNSPVPGEFPTQRPGMRSLMFSLICIWINGWVNNGEAGDLRRHRAHCDVTVMTWFDVTMGAAWKMALAWSTIFAFNMLRSRQMATIFQATFSNAFPWMKMYWFSIKISLKFVPKGQINNIPALV